MQCSVKTENLKIEGARERRRGCCRFGLGLGRSHVSRCEPVTGILSQSDVGVHCDSARSTSKTKLVLTISTDQSIHHRKRLYKSIA